MPRLHHGQEQVYNKGSDEREQSEVFLDYFTTTRAYLTGISRVYLRYCSASFFRFADQDIDKDIPRSVSNAFGKVMILAEALSVKIFHNIIHDFLSRH